MKAKRTTAGQELKKYSSSQTGWESQWAGFLFAAENISACRVIIDHLGGAWKHHHRHMWPLPTGPAVLCDRALLSNGRPTRSLIVPSPVAASRRRYETITQDKAGQRWEQLHGWALEGRRKASLWSSVHQTCGEYSRYGVFQGQGVQFVLTAVTSAILKPHSGSAWVSLGEIHMEYGQQFFSSFSPRGIW